MLFGVNLKFAMINFGLGIYGCLWVFIEGVSFGYGLWNGAHISWLDWNLKGFGCVFNEIEDGYVCAEFLPLKGWEVWRRAWGWKDGRKKEKGISGVLKWTYLIWIL